MRKLLEKIKRTKFYREKLVDTKFIFALKKIKRFLSKCKAKVVGIWKKEERYPRAVPLFEQVFTSSDFNEETLEDTKNLEPADVIVPIYGGYDYLVKLFKDLPDAGMPCRFILVDDKSPEERVHELEKEFAAKHDNVILLENEENLGFVKSVNRGLEMSKGHVALVNTDTELPKGYLYRLLKPILEDAKIASTTPYTNSATIFSFPNFCYNNPIYRGLDTRKLDAYFKNVKPHLAVAPTGVGFCMGMNRKAIDEVGFLNADKYDRGYCEENDWCQRAIKKGFKNVHVENLFVYHKHGGSFMSEEKKKLVESHLETLKKDYPAYDTDVISYIERDENKLIRNLLEMVIDTHEAKSILYFNHCLGGGATKYMEEKKEAFIQKGAVVTVIAFNVRVPVWTITFENERGKQTYELWSLEEITKVCEYLHFDEVYVNELVSFAHIWDMQEIIKTIAKKMNSAKLVMLMHDYFAVCPSTNLTNNDLVYCGMPGGEACEKCYTKHEYPAGYMCETRKLWIERWKNFLKDFDEVRCFSEDTRRRMESEFGNDLNYSLVPHEVNYMLPINKTTKTTDTINIGLIGVLTVHKGGEAVKALIKEIEARGLNINVKLIGRTEELDMKGINNFSETGAYALAELPKLIYENDIDLFLIPSVWPETFSYTAEEVMKMGMPVASFDIGAPADRIRKYSKGMVISHKENDNPVTVPASQVLDELLGFIERLGLKPESTNEKKILYLAEYISFSSRYRLEHLREELLYKGIGGDLVEVTKFPENVDWTKIAALVIYRCRYMDKLPEIMEEAKKNNVPIVYDIDDYIFDYEAIKDLEFLKDEEYKDFDVYSNLMKETMLHSDKIIVSTDYLKQGVLKTFPEKDVFVNRNVASTEMAIYSAKAYEKKGEDGSKFILGYYSGSHTHNKDFELVEDEILEFLLKHENAFLKIVGCLILNEKFDAVSDRIIREGFMDWQKLPESISKIDVNLMPLENSFFHKCKSENKWMEAGLVGVATIGSWNEELEGAIAKDSCVLCKNAEDWKNGLEKLYSDKKYRKELAENARSYVYSNKTTLFDNGVKEWII